MEQTLNDSHSEGGGEDEEYDPARPNNYQKIIAKRHRLKREMETKRKILEKHKKIAAQEASNTVVNLDVSAEDAFRMRVMRSQGQSQTEKVKRMMSNMGWTEGKGLGRQEQGMLNPLIQKKNAGSSTTGIIVESTIQTVVAPINKPITTDVTTTADEVMKDQ